MLIKTKEWRMKPEDMGKPAACFSYVKQRSLIEVESQLKAVLAGIYIESWSCDALHGAQWVSTNMRLLDDGFFPEGQPVVVFRKGATDGYLLQVLCHTDRDKLVVVFTVKYLGDEESIWGIVKNVSAAFSDAF